MQKKKSGVKKCLEICAIKGGGVGPLMANAILNFHFDYLTTSLRTYPCTLSRLSKALIYIMAFCLNNIVISGCRGGGGYSSGYSYIIKEFLPHKIYLLLSDSLKCISLQCRMQFTKTISAHPNSKLRRSQQEM